MFHCMNRYHCMSLARREMDVTFVGYGGEPCVAACLRVSVHLLKKVFLVVHTSLLSSLLTTLLNVCVFPFDGAGEIVCPSFP